MTKLEEKAINIANQFKKQTFFDERCNDLVGNIAYEASIISAKEQQEIDIKKASNAFCIANCGHLQDHCECLTRVELIKSLKEDDK